MNQRNLIAKPDRGFTLVELIIVIVIMGIMAGVVATFLAPTLNSYAAASRRTNLADIAQTSLQKMGREIRLAVPNSIRSPGGQCFELLPTSTGGRYRTAADTVNDPANAANPSAFVDTAVTTSAFDILSVLEPTPADGDWVVINNQNADDAYIGTNRAALVNASAPYPEAGKARFTFATPQQFPVGYTGGRFVVVPNNGGNPAVVYTCTGTNNGTLDAQGNGTGRLMRVERAFANNAPTTEECKKDLTGPVLATRVRSCTFTYNPNPSPTQQSGFMALQIELTETNESVVLSTGVHVDNVP